MTETETIGFEGDSYIQTEPPLIWISERFDLSPIQRQFLNHWHANRAGDGIPLRELAYAPEHLRAFLGYLIVCEERQDDFFVRLCGSRIVEAWGFDISGMMVSAMDDHYRAQFGNTLNRQAVERRVPVAGELPGTPEGVAGSRCVAVPVQAGNLVQVFHLVSPTGPQKKYLLI